MRSGRRGIIALAAASHFAAAATPTFNLDISPIVLARCAPCHQPGQSGPFPLISYADVKKHARQIVQVTRSRYMPPWLPQAGYGDFLDEQRLSASEIALFAAWAAAGAPEGASVDHPVTPALPVARWQLGKPDLVVIAGSSFSVPATGADVFWNFTFRPPLPASRYIRAIEIRPVGVPQPATGQATQFIHHANLLIDRSRSAERLETKAGSGFPGMELTLTRNPLDPVSHFLFWKPGSSPREEPAGLSWRLDPGNLLVLNTHLQPSGKTEQIQPAIGLYFTDQPPSRFPILVELERDSALHIPPGAAHFRIGDDFRLPIDADLLAIYPHAHYLGKELIAYATLPDKTRRWLIRIPDWDLNWQSVYRYRSPVFLPAGTLISMRFTYDNSIANPRNPHHPPRQVEAGNQATDEMGHLWLQLLPRGHGDRRRDIEDAILRHRLEKAPSDFEAHLNLGALALSRLRTQEAVSELQTAIHLHPQSSEAHDMLGSALRSLGRAADALVEYRLALAIDPANMDARYNLAVSLTRAGRFLAAIPDFRAVVEAFPESGRLHNEFGELLARSGDLAAALTQFDRALALEPANPAALANRAWALQKAAEHTPGN